MRAPCVKCGNLLHTGEGKVIVGLSADDLDELACATSDPSLRRRLLCALSLIDPERADRVGAELQRAWSEPQT